MGTVSITELTTGQQNVNATEINQLVTPILNEFNGSISNANISATAAIAYSKLNLTGAVLNADLAGSIAFTKLATLTDGNILVGNGSNQAASVAVSGDVTLANTGATTVTDLTISSEADGDLLQFDGTNWIRVAKGSANQILKSDGTDVGWAGSTLGVAKALAVWDGTASPPITADWSYNLSGTIGSSATGTFELTWDTNFADANYVIVATVLSATAGATAVVTAQAAGTCTIKCFNSGTSAQDPTKVFVAAYGAQ